MMTHSARIARVIGIAIALSFSVSSCTVSEILAWSQETGHPLTPEQVDLVAANYHPEVPVTTVVAPKALVPSAAALARLAKCESTNNPRAVSKSGKYRGLYQFHQGTWNGVAKRAGRPDLVGVSPDHASPADQDAMARALFAERGSQPWPECGRHL